MIQGFSQKQQPEAKQETKSRFKIVKSEQKPYLDKTNFAAQRSKLQILALFASSFRLKIYHLEEIPAARIKLLMDKFEHILEKNIE